MELTRKKIRITFTAGILGTKSGDPAVTEKYIASKRPEGSKPDEAASIPLDEELILGSTVFSRTDDDRPAIFDYQVKGFFKDAQGCLNRIPALKLTAHKKIIDGLVFVEPRLIPLELPEQTGLDWCQRPLRADTAQGPRVALARSEEAPAGTTMDLEIVLLDKKLWKTVEGWLNYGALRGIGQWRNSGKGKFTWELLEG